MRILSTFIFLTFIFFTKGQTFTSSGAGNWTTGSNWAGGTAPALGSPGGITTNNSHTINISSNITLGSNISINGGTVLNIAAGVTLTINGNMTFQNGSIVNVSGGGSLVVNGNVTNNNNSDDISINGTITINGNFTGGNGSAVIGTGSMNITGSVSTSGSGAVFGSTVDCASNCNNSFVNPLPVDFVSFSATCMEDNEGFDLKWVTYSELSSNYFEVQRSRDGVIWNSVGNVTAQGNSNTKVDYIFSDYTSSLSSETYYRILQVDLDGSTVEYGPWAANCSSNEQFKILSNPISNKLILSSQVQTNRNDIEFSIIDIYGKICYSDIQTLEKGFNENSFELSNLKAGVYFLNFTSNSEKYSLKFMKID